MCNQREDQYTFWSYLAQFLAWEIFGTKVAEKIKTHFMSKKTFFPPKIRTDYETIASILYNPADDK